MLPKVSFYKHLQPFFFPFGCTSLSASMPRTCWSHSIWFSCRHREGKCLCPWSLGWIWLAWRHFPLRCSCSNSFLRGFLFFSAVSGFGYTFFLKWRWHFADISALTYQVVTLLFWGIPIPGALVGGRQVFCTGCTLVTKPQALDEPMRLTLLFSAFA